MRLRSLFLGGAAALAAAIVVPLATPAAARQEASDDPRLTGPEAHRIRGALAWRRAVWTGDRDAYAYAARELEQALRQTTAADHGGRRDFSTVFLLACSRAWRGDVPGAASLAQEARTLAPSFPGHLLLDAVLASPEPRGTDWKAQFTEAVEQLDRYQVALATYDRGAPFARELEYLGHHEKGVRLFWLDLHDRALVSFDGAMQIVRAEGRTPSAELVRRSSQCHKSLQQFDVAERMIRASLERDPGEPSHYQVLGQLAADRERREEARAWYQRALDRKLDYTEPRAKLAFLAMESGESGHLYAMRVHLEAYRAIYEAKWESGAAARDPAVEANIHSAFGHYWWGRAAELADAGRLEEARPFHLLARRELEAALLREPGCRRALSTLIQVLYQLGAPPEESQPYQKRLDDMHRKEPGSPTPHTDTFCDASPWELREARSSVREPAA